MMSKRFQQLGDTSILDTQTNEKYYAPNETELIDLLNEQEETIEELHISDHMGWKRAEHFEKELKQKKIYIKRLEYKVQKFKEMNNEQQATIEYLTKSRDKWRELSNSFLFYCKCYEKAIERAFEEKPYPTEDDINRIYAELEKELEDE